MLITYTNVINFVLQLKVNKGDHIQLSIIKSVTKLLKYLMALQLINNIIRLLTSHV